MSEFCLSFNEKSLNKLLNAAYQNADIRSKLSGTTEIDLNGSKETISWELCQSPTVLFVDLETSWKAIDISGKNLDITPNMFCIETQTNIAVNGGTGKSLPLSFISIAQLFDTIVSFKIKGVRIDNYDSLDKGVIIGISHDLIHCVNTSLGIKDDGSIPRLFSLDFLNSIGIHSNKIGMTKVNRNIQVWGSNSGDNPYSTLSPISNNEFTLKLSNHTFLDVLNKNFNEHKGESRASQDFGEITYTPVLGHNGRKVHVEVGAEYVDAQGLNGGLVDMVLKPSLNINGTSAHLGLYGTFGYTSKFTPDEIHVNALIYMAHQHIHCELYNFDPFAVLLDPWGFDAHVLWPLTELSINYITAVIPDQIRIPFDINIPITKVSLGGDHILWMNVDSLCYYYESDGVVISGCIEAKID